MPSRGAPCGHDDRDRHLGAVVGGRPLPVLLVARRVVVAEHRGLLEQGQLAGARRRSRRPTAGVDQRGVAEAGPWAGRTPGCRRRRRCRPRRRTRPGSRRPTPSSPSVEDPELGEPVAALADHEVAGEGVDVLEPDGRVVRDQRLPLLVAGGVDRRRGEREVLGAVVVQDQEAVLAADHGVLDAVLHALRGAGRRRGTRRSGSSASRTRYSRGDLGAGADHQEAVAAGAADAEPRTARRSRGGPARRRRRSVPSRCRQTLSGRQASSTVV